MGASRRETKRSDKAGNARARAALKPALKATAAVGVADALVHGAVGPGIAGSAYLGWKAGKAIKRAVRGKNDSRIAANTTQDIANRERAASVRKPISKLKKSSNIKAIKPMKDKKLTPIKNNKGNFEKGLMK